MTDNRDDLPSDLGQTLAKLRNAAGLSQGDIVNALGKPDISLEIKADQSRISRIENGTVSPGNREIETYLSAINTQEARDYQQFLKKSWQNIDRPSFWNPQREDLWKAEICLQKLKKLIAEGVPDYFLPQAKMHQERIQEEAKYLTALKHSIAYVGSIGVGKTTAICQLTGLVIPKEKKFANQSVFAVGSGRTTVCEVGIRGGDKFGIRIKPETSEEIDRLVDDLCGTHYTNSEDKDDRSDILPQEIQRLLLNMAGLKKNTFADLVKSCENKEILALNFKERLKLQERKRDELWFDDQSSAQTGIEWLKETFKAINFGNNREVTLPQRIDVIVPDQVIFNSDYELDIIDTRGIDDNGTAIRRDLIEFLKNPRTLTVLCSRFKDAPDRQICDLIENRVESGSEQVLKDRTIILCLPQNQEDEEMNNPETGDYVDSKEEAYSFKWMEIQDQIKPKLKQLQVTDIPVQFFNAKSGKDEAAEISNILLEKIHSLRMASGDRLNGAINAIESLIKNQKEQNAKQAYQTVNRALKHFLDKYRNKPLSLSPVYLKLTEEMEKTHQKTIRAAMKRQGIYGDKFDIYFLLGNGARQVAWNSIVPIFYKLKGVIETLESDPMVQEYAESFLKEILSNWEIWKDEFLDYTQKLCEITFKSHLLASRWLYFIDTITGSGYRNEVIQKLKDWFNEDDQYDWQKSLNSQVQKAWQDQVIAKLEKLTDSD
jgi:transcriptional regulator with XRE-family HTH domain